LSPKLTLTFQPQIECGPPLDRGARAMNAISASLAHDDLA
jgi:hypothetical protein